MSTKNIIIYGSGMLGSHLNIYLNNKILEQNLDWNIKLYSINEVDITNIEKLKNTIINNSIVINCAAYTAVDNAEKNKDLAYAVNSEAVKQLAILCNERNCKLVHISTDFIYGINNNYDEIFESTNTNPLNIYGLSKLDGENNIKLNMESTNYLILRVAWTFGIYGNNFIKKIYEQLIATNVNDLKVVTDQFGRPTSIELIITVIYNYILGNLKEDIYNLTCSGDYCTKYDIANYIKEIIHSNKKINKCLTKDFDKIGNAIRQNNSKLNCNKIQEQLKQFINFNNYTWKKEIKKYLELLKKYEKI